ncbi:glycosyltransferase family 2 protein [Salmonella enterica]|nr:glycosyltransferase family 2 protein [Salmonella enterica]EJF5983077.1 glycosyltransferase family 2 protein [Salmonella enterica]
MAIYVSIISHGHEDMLASTPLLNELSQLATVIIKNNKKSSKGTLYNLKVNDNIIILDENDYGLGFGHNNNYVFKYAIENLGLNGNDYFCTINPDIIVDKLTVSNVIQEMHSRNYELSTLFLYLDDNKKIKDESLRNFPVFIDFLKSYFLGKRDKVKLEKIDINAYAVDWAAGSFLIFKASLFMKLKGFDQRYFMYCEDIDICYRAKKMGIRLICLTNYSAIHLAQRASRTIFSRNFLWHLKSIIIYTLATNKKVKSIL